MTTGAVDYTGFLPGTTDSNPKLYIKNNSTDASIKIYHNNYNKVIAKTGTVNDIGVPTNTQYNSSNITISGTGEINIGPNKIKEVPDDVISVSIGALSNDITTQQYYGIELTAKNYVFIDGDNVYGDTLPFTSLYLMQYGYPANGTVYPSTNFTDFAAIPSYETAGKISRNLDIEIRDNSYTNTSKWTLSVYKSYDGNTFGPSVDTDVKLIAAGNTGNGQLIVTGGNKKVTVTAEFPENVRKGYKDGNIAV